MAMYSLHLMRIALTLAEHNPVYQDLATKFFEHFLHIAEAMSNMGEEGIGLWDEEDQFYYDVLNPSEGGPIPLKVRSMVGLIPLFAVEILDPKALEPLSDFHERVGWLMKYLPRLAAQISCCDVPGVRGRGLLSLLRPERLRPVLRRMLDETEFLSDHGVRALSRAHRDQPYRFSCCGQVMSVDYVPGESETELFGGNSNWRGPVWMPLNFLVIESLRRYHRYFGESFRIECPTGSGVEMNLGDVADELCRRLARLFLRAPDGRRAVFGDSEKNHRDPHFRDYVLFHEYFHGDTGQGLGASHQTGWSSLISELLLPSIGENGPSG